MRWEKIWHLACCLIALGELPQGVRMVHSAGRMLAVRFALVIAALVAFAPRAVASLPVDLKTFESHSRITVRVDSGVKVTIKNDPQGFTLHFPDLSMVDLGAPFGEEKSWSKGF